MKEEIADMGAGVDAIGQRDEVRALGVKLLGNIGEVAKRTAQPVELPHYQLIALPYQAQCLFKAGAFA